MGWTWRQAAPHQQPGAEGVGPKHLREAGDGQGVLPRPEDDRRAGRDRGEKGVLVAYEAAAAGRRRGVGGSGVRAGRAVWR